MPPDSVLLQRYVKNHDEHAFAELVGRYINLVFAAALRRTDGRTHLAEEIVQKVFLDLARKASRLLHHPALIGWLHRSTRYAAIDALRDERRRQKLAQSVLAMTEAIPSSDPSINWEQLRPVLDDAMDQLKERDRELLLLRFFGGLTFVEAGVRLDLSEDAARRRVERALDKLRHHLGRRGLTSTTAALGLLLANQPLVAAPSGLAASVITMAMAAAPAGGAGLLTVFLMNKTIASAASALVAAGLTTVAWTYAAHPVSARDLAALREENRRLLAAAADPAAAVQVAAEYAAQAGAIVQAIKQRAPATTARGHSNHGQGTAHDAALTFNWACDVTDATALGKLIYFDPNVREKAQAVLDGMPDSIRENFNTPEEFYGFLVALGTIEAPPPAAEVIERTMEEVTLSPDRMAVRKRGSSVNFHEYQQTPEGWKFVFPERGVEPAPNILNSETLAKLVGR